MIATGTDVKPLEVLLFMRNVKSSGYFEQMKGRGTRTISYDDLKRVTRTAKEEKDRFIIIDAVGVTKSKKTDSRPLERKPNVSLKDLLGAVAMGVKDEDLFTSLANRLIRLDRHLTNSEKEKIEEITGGKSLKVMIKDLLGAYDPDTIEDTAEILINKIPKNERNSVKEKECYEKAQEDLILKAAIPFTGELNKYIENVRKIHDQIIDNINIDRVTRAEWDTSSREQAENVLNEFKEYIEANKDEIIALSIFYDQPYRRRELTFKMVKDLMDTLKREKPRLAPHYVWKEYSKLENVKENSPKSELVALVSLIRRVIGIDSELTPYNKTVDVNFKNWIFKKHACAGPKFNEEQMKWLRMLKEHIATSFHVELDDLDYTPFDSQGGRGKMYELFGDNMKKLINELNEVLSA